MPTITIPSSVTTIGDEAFYKCTGLTTITIPSSVTTIDTWAFHYCTGLKTVVIDSKTIVSGLTSSSSQGHLLENATTVYIINDAVSSLSTWFTSEYSSTTSDKSGYTKYVKN